MAARNAPKTHGTERLLPGIWHWLVMLPVTAFALLVCAGVLWMIAVSPLVARVAPAPLVVATAPPPLLAVTDTAERTTRLQRLLESDAVRQLSWRPAVTGYQFNGQALTVSTSLPAGTASVYAATDMANRLLLDMHAYGDTVATATVKDNAGQTLITLAYDAVIKPVGK